MSLIGEQRIGRGGEGELLFCNLFLFFFFFFPFKKSKKKEREKKKKKIDAGGYPPIYVISRGK